MYLSENIRYLRKKNHLSQDEIAKQLGYKSFTTIQKWEMGIAEPPLAKLSRLSEIFNVDLDNLTHQPLFEGGSFETKNGGIRIPILGKVAAGQPVEAMENVIDYEELSGNTAENDEYFGLLIKGASMEPRMQEGDIVIVHKQADVDSGDIAIVLINGAEATCKKVKKTESGIMLLPNNSKYETLFYSNEEVCSLPVTIIGKVVELRSKF